jgi:hypothetical protein
MAEKLSVEQIKARMEELVSIDRITGWTKNEEKEFDELLELHPDETEDDEEYLMIMDETSDLKRLNVSPASLSN